MGGSLDSMNCCAVSACCLTLCVLLPFAPTASTLNSHASAMTDDDLIPSNRTAETSVSDTLNIPYYRRQPCSCTYRHYCLNGGTCFYFMGKTPTCSCPVGYEGRRCESRNIHYYINLHREAMARVNNETI